MILVKKILTLFFILFPLLINGQEFKLGVNFSTNVFQKYTLEGESYTPKTSHYSYYPNNYEGNLIIDESKTLNSLSFGGNFKFSRKQISIVTEPQFTIEYNIFKLYTPFESVRILNRRAVRIPVFLTYHLIKNSHSIYLIGGGMICIENNFDFQQLNRNYYFGDQSAYESNIDFGKNHFEGVFYDDRTRLNYIVGLGKKIGNHDFSLRYVNTITEQKYLGQKFQVELNISIYLLSNKDITRKNYLYEE